MDFTPYLNARELSKLTEAALEIGQAFLADPMVPTDEEISEANQILRASANALKSLGYADIRAEDMPAAWLDIANNTGELLVREDIIGEYWNDSAVEFGRLRKDQYEAFAPVIDWDTYARNQDSTVVNFANDASYGLGNKENNYYIF